MIHYIPIPAETRIYTRADGSGLPCFAFFDTHTQGFITLNGIAVWDCEEAVIQDWEADEGSAPDAFKSMWPIDRLLCLIPRANDPGVPLRGDTSGATATVIDPECEDGDQDNIRRYLFISYVPIPKDSMIIPGDDGAGEERFAWWNNLNKEFIEIGGRMAWRSWGDFRECWHVDCGADPQRARKWPLEIFKRTIESTRIILKSLMDEKNSRMKMEEKESIRTRLLMDEIRGLAEQIHLAARPGKHPLTTIEDELSEARSELARVKACFQESEKARGQMRDERDAARAQVEKCECGRAEALLEILRLEASLRIKEERP
jgi:hypothetical protein